MVNGAHGEIEACVVSNNHGDEGRSKEYEGRLRMLSSDPGSEHSYSRATKAAALRYVVRKNYCS